MAQLDNFGQDAVDAFKSTVSANTLRKYRQIYMDPSAHYLYYIFCIPISFIVKIELKGVGGVAESPNGVFKFSNINALLQLIVDGHVAAGDPVKTDGGVVPISISWDTTTTGDTYLIISILATKDGKGSRSSSNCYVIAAGPVDDSANSLRFGYPELIEAINEKSSISYILKINKLFSY